MKKSTPPTPAEALAKLEALCAAAERCPQELMLKLSRWGIGHDTAQKIIARLVRDRFVDEARFARAFVADKYRFARWGRHKIRMALIAKQIPTSVITEALSEAIDEEEYRAALRLTLRHLIYQLGDEARTYEGRTRIFRRAAARGYESALIAETLRETSLWRADK